MKPVFAFDLDGTITREEILPRIAAIAGDCGRMAVLTRQAVSGELPFAESLRMRVEMLQNIPLEEIRRIIDNVPLDEVVASFIRERPEDCAIITSNLDIWIKPLADKLGCRVFASSYRGAKRLFILDKAEAVGTLQSAGHKVIAVGDGANDLEMLRAADVGIAFGGVNAPCAEVLAAAGHFAGNGRELCALLGLFLDNTEIKPG